MTDRNLIVHPITAAWRQTPVSLKVAAICILSLLIHLPLLWGQFTNYDDGKQITQFDGVTNRDLSVVREMLTTNYEYKNSNPMYLSFLLNWYMTPGSYMGFAVINLVWMLITIVVFFRFSKLFLSTSKWQLWSTLLFSVYYINSDIVGWMSARCHFGGMPFFLGAFIAWDNYVCAVSMKKRILWYIASICLAGFATLNKTTYIAFLPCIFLFDLYRCRRFSLMYLPDKMLLGLVLVGIISIPGKVADKATNTAESQPLITQVITMMPEMTGKAAQYYASAIIPGPIAVAAGRDLPDVRGFFNPPEKSELYMYNLLPIVNLTFLFLIAFSALLIWWHLKEPLPLLAILCTGIAVAPILGLIPFGVDFGFRYLWIPSVFFSMAIVALARQLSIYAGKHGKWISATILVAYIGWHAIFCFVQCINFSTNSRYWENCVTHFHEAYFCAFKLGRSYDDLDPQKAAEAFWHQQQVETHHKWKHNNDGFPLAKSFEDAGHMQKAALFYERVIVWDRLKASNLRQAKDFLKAHPIAPETRARFLEKRTPFGW